MSYVRSSYVMVHSFEHFVPCIACYNTIHTPPDPTQHRSSIRSASFRCSAYVRDPLVCNLNYPCYLLLRVPPALQWDQLFSEGH